MKYLQIIDMKQFVYIFQKLFCRFGKSMYFCSNILTLLPIRIAR